MLTAAPLLYTEAMKGGRILSMILSAFIFFLQGGDCLSMPLKSKQAHDCCKKGQCRRTNPDPCCQTSAKTDIAKDQVKQRTALPDLAVMPMIAVWAPPAITLDFWDRHRATFAPSPPGERGNFPLPLLV